MRRNRLLAASGLALFMTAASAYAQRSPCRERFIKLCDGKDEDSNPICEMLKQDAEETPESIELFLVNIRGLSEPVRQDLICARLLGSKTVVNLKAIFTFPLTFQSGKGHWSLDIRDPLYGKLIAAQGKLADLGKGASNEAVVDLSGFIDSVSMEYVRGEFSSFKINVAEAELTNIRTQYASGNIADIVQALHLRIREVYREYMTMGHDNPENLRIRFFLPAKP